MPGKKDIVATLLGVRVARALYGRWRRLSARDRERLEPLAEDVKERALKVRGAADDGTAGRELLEANHRLADAMVESAHVDPEVSEIEVSRLRDELSRELERLAGADVRASRGGSPDPADNRASSDTRG